MAGAPPVLLTGSSGGVGRVAQSVLAGADQRGLARAVYFSSAQVFGFAEGEGSPAYLPVDDDHPVRASRPYGMSKRLAEVMCQAWTTRMGIPTIVLRPVLTLDDEGLAAFSPERAELGAFVHVEDVQRPPCLPSQPTFTVITG